MERVRKNNKKPPQFLTAYLKWVDKLAEDIFSWFAADHIFNDLKKILKPIVKAFIHIIAAMLVLSVLSATVGALF